MPRQPRFPKYPSKAHPNGQARIWLWGRHRYLGRYGSPQSRRRYRQLLIEWDASHGVPPAPGAKPEEAMTVAEAVARFLTTAEAERTNPDGSRPWDELHGYKHACRPLLALCADMDVKEFGPKTLKLVQRAMAEGSWVEAWLELQKIKPKRTPGPWCRRVVNRQTVRLQTLWRWLESEELVPGGASDAIGTVPGLRKHQHGVREKAKVPPAPADRVAAILPYLNPVARDAVELLQLSGARPGELCRWTPADVIRGGKVEVAPGSYAELGACWCVWLRDHKTAEDGDAGRFILLGPRGQAIITPYLDRPPDCPLFSPAEGRRRQLVTMRAKRKSPVQPSQIDRSKPDPAKRPGDRYTPDSLTGAIQYACARAGVPKFTAYQLRHSAGTAIGKAGDAEASRIALGHADLRTTRTYMLDDLEKAAQVVAKVG